jgi:hypothetical protein
MWFDGQLVADGQSLLFTLPPSGSLGIANDLVLRLMVTGTTGSGTMLSTSSMVTMPLLAPGLQKQHVWIAQNPPPLVTPNASPPLPVAASAKIDASGNVMGMFQGYVLADDNISPKFNCSGLFLWSLTPR